MPYEFIYRKKSGFTPPLNKWLRNDKLFRYFKEIILDGKLIKYFNKNFIIKILEKSHKSNKNISRFTLN